MTADSYHKNLYALLEHTVNRFAGQVAYYESHPKLDDEWQPITWQDYKNQVDTLALALLKQGLKPNESVSILAGNCLAWPVADLATIAAGGVGVGLYPTSSAEQCAYILNHAESRFLVLDSQQQLDKILSISEPLPWLQQIIVYGEFIPPESNDQRVISWSDFIDNHHPKQVENQTNQPEQQKGWEDYQRIAHSRSYEDTVIIVYTSGTTGNPKGACLSNRYVISSIQALEHFIQSVIQSLPTTQQHALRQQTFNTLSYLPYCHVAERISGMYTRLYRGDAAYLVNDISRLSEVLQVAQPQGFGGLPRIFEKLYAAILKRVESGQGFDKQSFIDAMELNQKIKQLTEQNLPIPETLQSAFERADQEIYSKVRAFFGERILYCSSGAAPLPEKVLEMFEYAGNIHILEAYGLTEFVCCAFNTPQDHRAQSVGKAMLGCQIKIAEDGEILLKGPQMFSGYFKDPKATDEVIDPQGWLHTGDIGRLDEDNFLYITGRKKEFIKTSTGKKIAPLAIENLCKRNHLISNVMVYGDNKKYLSALITLNEAELFAYADQIPLEYEQFSDLSQHPQIQSLLANVIEEVNQRVSRTEQIKKYIVLKHDFSIDRNEITPTGKIKRKQISQHYAELIESMYEPDDVLL